MLEFEIESTIKGGWHSWSLLTRLGTCLVGVAGWCLLFFIPSWIALLPLTDQAVPFGAYLLVLLLSGGMGLVGFFLTRTIVLDGFGGYLSHGRVWALLAALAGTLVLVASLIAVLDTVALVVIIAMFVCAFIGGIVLKIGSVIDAVKTRTDSGWTSSRSRHNMDTSIRVIGQITVADGSCRQVYEREGLQYVVDDDGQLVYGTWFLMEEGEPDCECDRPVIVYEDE